jgi:hypothetical protein
VVCFIARHPKASLTAIATNGAAEEKLPFWNTCRGVTTPFERRYGAAFADEIAKWELPLATRFQDVRMRRLPKST